MAMRGIRWQGRCSMADHPNDSITEIQDCLNSITDYANAVAMAAHGMVDDNERAGMSRLAADILINGERAAKLVSQMIYPWPRQ